MYVQDASLLEPLEDGLNALLSIEVSMLFTIFHIVLNHLKIPV